MTSCWRRRLTGYTTEQPPRRISKQSCANKSPRGHHSFAPCAHIRQDVSRLCDRAPYRNERFSVADCNIDAPKNPHSCRAFREVGVGIYKYFERPKEPDKQVGEISVDDSGQVGPWTLCEVWGDIVADLKTPPCNLGTAKFPSKLITLRLPPPLHLATSMQIPHQLPQPIPQIECHIP